MTTETTLYLAGLFTGVEICLCLVLAGLVIRDFLSERTRKHGFEHLIDLKTSCTLKRLSEKTVYRGEVVSIYGGKI